MDSNKIIPSMFNVPRALIGMLHLPALPGSPGQWSLVNSTGLDGIINRAIEEAKVYCDAGFHALLIENMHDRPYLKGAVGPETVATMAVVGREVRQAAPLPLGVQVLAGANRAAIAVALACGACFVRAEGYVFAHVADEGIIESDAGALLRYRKQIGADHVKVFADVKKKHSSHAITSDMSLADTAHAAEFALADGVIVTGTSTGRQTEPNDVHEVATAVSIPTLVGSGVTPANIGHYPHADGFIIGSVVKRDGHWANVIDPRRVQAVVTAFAALAEKAGQDF
jgi:membrane complex biogenesis BtpA family protein